VNLFFRLSAVWKKWFPADRDFAAFVYAATGVRPANLDLYRQALRHQSKFPGTENNERLELLGDSVIDLMVIDHLYKKFPFKDEGFISNLKSKIVNRVQLNELGKRMGLLEKLEYNRRSFHGGSTDLAGNAFEALVGAIYLDAGIDKAKAFVQQRVLLQLLDLSEIQSEDKDYKSRLYHYAQKNGYSIEFRLQKESLRQGRTFFHLELVLQGKTICEGEGFNKKTAEQQASRRAIELLDIKPEANE